VIFPSGTVHFKFPTSIDEKKVRELASLRILERKKKGFPRAGVVDVVIPAVTALKA
jgi:hypothetical protein